MPINVETMTTLRKAGGEVAKARRDKGKAGAGGRN